MKSKTAAAAASLRSIIMDIHYYFHRWLLCMAMTLVLHQCQDVSVMADVGRVCPQGQLIHKDHLHGTVSCCLPTRCGVGYHVKACVNNGTKDTCEVCGPKTNQSRRTSSFNMNEQCQHWILNEKCQTPPNNEVYYRDPKTKRCLCDIENGVRFLEPEVIGPGIPMVSYCQLFPKNCLSGEEPTVDGDCTPCEPGYFKAKEGYSLCEPLKDCAQLDLEFTDRGDRFADNNCSDPEIITTQKPIVTVKPTPTTTTTEKIPVTSAPKPVLDTTLKEDPLTVASSQSTNEGDDSAAHVVWPIIGTIFVILVIVISLIIVFLRRRRVSICGCCKSCCVWLKGNTLDMYGVTQCPSNLPPGDHHHKNEPTTLQYIDSHQMTGEKIMNNNINGGVIESPRQIYRQHFQHNGNVVQFSRTESSDSETQVQFQNQQNSFQANVGPPNSRPGILRNGNKPHQGQIVYAQARATRPQDASMDSIGREKLHVNIDGYQPNQDLGENDPLLIAEDTTGVGTIPSHGVVFQNRGGGMVTNHSPPVAQAASNQVMYLPPNVNFNPHCQNMPGYVHPMSNMNPNFSGSNSSGSSSPALQSGPQNHQVTFAPTLDTVTYKRSISVITNPEGEAEEEIDANVPRFSQLLPDSENSSIALSNPILRMAAQDRGDTMAMDSPQRDTTHQTRPPSDRLQGRPLQNPIAPAFVNPPPHQPVGRHPVLNNRPPILTGPLSSSTENVPDHYIMDLKEHQLATSLSSSFANPASSGETMLKHPAYPNNFNLEDFTATGEQTDMKILGGTIKEEERPPAASAKSRFHPLGPRGTAPSARIHQPSGEETPAQNVTKISHAPNLSENKRLPVGSSSADRKRTPSADRRHVVASEDNQKLCSNKNSNQEDGDDVNKRLQQSGRGVSIEEEDDDEVKPDDSLEEDTEPKQIRDSTHPSENLDLAPGALKTVKKPEEQNVECNSVNEENIKIRSSATDGNGDTDLSSSESTQSSPSRTNMYRRTQSESTTGGADSTHKPPPRSMSEEKSQKADKPIAKVKPMPASDSSVNQVPTGSGAAEETTTSNEESEDESSEGSSLPDSHSSTPRDEADEEGDEEELRDDEERERML